MPDGNPTREGRRDPRAAGETGPTRTNRKPRRDVRGGDGEASGAASNGREDGSLDGLIGGMARAQGGWWKGEDPRRAAADLDDHRAHYREHFAAGDRGDVAWDEALPAYTFGHVAGRAPENRGRRFEEVEGDLRAGCAEVGRTWAELRPFVRAGYLRTWTSV